MYGDPDSVPLTEESPLRTVNPYGATKLMCEQILQDVASANPQLKIAILRYFNPVGAHESGLIGEDPNDIPNNLMPFVSQVAVGRREKLSVFGSDYQTHDGTGVRDFIHVVDLANAHLAALNALENNDKIVVNVGTGKGYSVLDLVKAFEKVNGVTIPYELVSRRPGDAAECYADPSLAEQVIGWKAARGIEEMCRDTWKWQSMNPGGYKS